MSSRHEREPSRRRERRPERRDDVEISQEKETGQATIALGSRDRRQPDGERRLPDRQRARSKRRVEGEDGVESAERETQRAPRAPPVRSQSEREPQPEISNIRVRRLSGERNRRTRADSNDTDGADRLPRSRVDSARTGRSIKDSPRSPRSRTTENTLMNSVKSESDVSGSKTSARVPRNRSRAGNNRVKPEISDFQDFIGAAAGIKIGSLFADDNGDTMTNYTTESNIPDMTDQITVNSILMQATTDSEGFTVLFPEKYLEQKKRLVQITNYFESLQNKLSLEYKVKEATENILKFNGNDDSQADEAKKQLALTELKLKDISKGKL